MENLKQTNNWFVFFKNGRALYNRVNMHLPYTDERLDNGIVVAGISMRSIIPLQQANVTFSEPDFQVDLTWTGITPMQDCIDLTSDSGGSFASEVAHAHLEQVCRVTGQIVTRDSEVIPIDSKGFRDLSVGPRNYDVMRHHRLMWPIFDDGTAIVAVRGTPVSGDDAYMRMLFDGTQWVAITDLQNNDEFEEDGVTVYRAQWSVTDATGRRWDFKARNLFRCLFPFDTYLVTGQMMEFELPDGTLGYGLCESGFRL